MLGPTINVVSVCMGLKVWPVSNYTQQVPTSANIVVVPCKRTQHVGPNNVACCWPTIKNVKITYFRMRVLIKC